MKRLGLCWLVALGLAVASCTSSTPGAEPAQDAFASSEVPEQLAFEDLTPAPAVIKVAMVQPELRIPAEIALSHQEAVIVADLLYDGLTEAVGTQGRLAPGLATSWVANEDFTGWTFAVDPDRIDAEGVVEHFEALLADSSNLATAVALRDVESIVAISDHEVLFTLDRSEAGFAWLLSGVALSVTGPQGEPTGRYEVISDDDNGLLLGARDGGDAGDGPMPDVLLSWFETQRDAYNALTLGIADAALAPPDALDDAEQRFGVTTPARSISRFYGIDADSPNLADERLRRAVLFAVDRSEIVASSMAVPAYRVDGIAAPTVAGYGPQACDGRCDYDPASARRLVAEAAAGGVVPAQLRIVYSGDDQAATAARIAADLGSVGLPAVAIEQTPAELAATITNGGADLFAFGWVASSGSLDAIVAPLFETGSATNVGAVTSPEVDALIQRASTTGDDAQRWALLQQARTLGLNQARLLPLAVAKSYLVVRPGVDGLAVRADGSIDVTVRG